MSAAGRPDPIVASDDEPYWEYVRRGELRLQCCGSCGKFRYPPAPVCPRCLASAHEWLPLCGRGHVAGWTIFHRPYFPGLSVPYAVVCVETEEGPLLVGNFVGAEAARPRVGQPVEAFFEEVEFVSSRGRLCQWKPRAEISATGAATGD